MAKSKFTVLFLFGTRPEAIKLAPLIYAFSENKEFNVKICSTGQHKEMLQQVLDFFKIVPDYQLNVMKENQSLFRLTSEIIKKLGGIFKKESPELIFVQGDTTTTFMGALAGFYAKRKVAHIEAGLRSHNKFSPFPEEVNRVLVSHLADYHFAPTRGLGRILERKAVQMLVRPVTFLLLFGGAWFLARGLMSAPFALGLQVVAAGVALLAGGLLLHRYLSDQVPKTSAIKSDPAWLRSALWLLLSEFLYLILQHAGVLLLGMIRGQEEVGLYKIAHQSASLIPFGLVAVNAVIAPTLAQLYASNEIQRLRRIMLLAAGASLIFALPLVLLYLSAGSWFLKTMFGAAFTASAGALSIITIGQVVNVSAGPVGLLLVMSGYERLATISTGISSASNITLNLFLIPVYGVMGCAVATAASLIIFNLTALYFVITKISKKEVKEHDA